MTALLPARRVVGRAVAGAVVAATLVVLGAASPVDAATVGALAAALWLLTDLAEAVVGDYAGNALLGVLVLGFAGFVVATGRGRPLAFVAGPGLVGAWLLVDGVQHRRHGATRHRAPHAPRARPDAGPVRGLLGALLDRLLEPFRLGSADRDGPGGP